MSSSKLGFNATWSMAVGGMVGGGIFSVLGVVLSVAGRWAWLSFVLAGAIALASAHSYSRLAIRFGESGGAFTFLREIHRDGFAGSLSWVLLLGYVLTVSVYAFTFGHYLAHALSLGDWLPRAAAVAVIACLTWVNLRGVGEAAGVEVVTVWGKLAVLVALAAVGIWRWAPERLSEGAGSPGITGALMGAAVVFMAYEGFQLLAYDYDEIRDAETTLPRAAMSAVVCVILIYVAVTLGAAMLVGASTLIQKEEVALALAGREAAGSWGLVLVTVAAAFSTASAINATLFATARLMEDVARAGELPALLERENRRGIPSGAVLTLAGLAMLLAALGSLSTLVEAASLTFLFTFATVNFLAWREAESPAWIGLAGGLGSSAAGAALLWRLAVRTPWVLAALVAVALGAIVGRPLLRKRLAAD